MRASRTSGSVEGVLSDGHPYSDSPNGPSDKPGTIQIGEYEFACVERLELDTVRDTDDRGLRQTLQHQSHQCFLTQGIEVRSPRP